MAKPTGQNLIPQQGAFGSIVRIYWMLVGNIVMFACAITIAQRSEKSFVFGTADRVFWIVIATVIAARYIDIRFLDGQTAAGQPASITDWKRYAGLIIAVAAVAWAAVHAIARFA